MGLPEHTAASLAAEEKVKMATHKYRMSCCKKFHLTRIQANFQTHEVISCAKYFFSCMMQKEKVKK